MPRSIPNFLLDIAERLPEKTAIVSKQRNVTFSQLLNEALTTAECLREQGVCSGDRVGVCMEKSVDQISVILGILFSNAVIVPILPRLKQPNIQHIIQNSGMTALVTDSHRLNEVTAFSDMTRLIIGHGELREEWPSLAYMRRFMRPNLFFNRIGADNAAIIYSSGSTGRPKGILIAHRNLADGADIVSEYLYTHEHDRIACVLSFNFDYGLNQIWQTLRKGCTLYLHDLLLPNELFSLISDAKITALPVMPVILSQMFDKRLKLNTSVYDFSSLRYVCTTGGRVSGQMLADLKDTFPNTQVYSMFGLTEAFRGTYLHPDKIASHPTSIGKSIPGVEILVLDENGEECLPNTVGELVQRGATVSKGYWRDPENTAKVFRTHPKYPGELLVFSGDSVVRDEDGYLYFVARRDDMIKTKGFRVSPTEVESEVVSHPDIVDAVVFSVPNIAVGEDIVCTYTTISGHAIPDHTLTQYFKNTLPSHMVPAFILHFASFPITGNAGKLDRKSIKQEGLERLGMHAVSTNLNLSLARV